MNYRNAIESIMKDKGVTQAELASRVGMKNQTNISEAFKRDMKISIVAKLADALGYDLMLVKRKPGRKITETITVEDTPYVSTRSKAGDKK